MDKSVRKNILLGLFVLIGIVLFIFGIFQVGSKNQMFSKTFGLTARFTNASGLKTGSNVRFNGVNVGIVKSIKLINDTLVQVDLQIENSKKTFITRSAIASIASDGLMGDKIINIVTYKNGGEPIHENDTILSHNPLNTDMVMQTLNVSNENIKEITENLKTLTSDLNSKDGTVQALYKDPAMANSLKRSFNNLDAASNKVLAVSTSLQQITAQIQHGNGAFETILYDTSVSHNIGYMINKLKDASVELNKTSSQLSVTVQHANSGNGTVNMLLTDTAFASEVQQSMLNIKKASAGLDENMEALKHSLLLRRYFKKKAKEN